MENGLISGLFGPHFERTGCPKAGTSIQCDPSLDNCGTRTSTSGLVIREPTDQSANTQLHFRSRKNEGMAEEEAWVKANASQIALDHKKLVRRQKIKPFKDEWEGA